MRPSRLRPWQLVAVWVLYWLGLFVISFREPLETYWHVTHTPGAHGSASFEFSGNPLRIAGWVLGPPLLLTIVWLLARHRSPDRGQS